MPESSPNYYFGDDPSTRVTVARRQLDEVDCMMNLMTRLASIQEQYLRIELMEVAHNMMQQGSQSRG